MKCGGRVIFNLLRFPPINMGGLHLPQLVTCEGNTLKINKTRFWQIVQWQLATVSGSVVGSIVGDGEIWSILNWYSPPNSILSFITFWNACWASPRTTISTYLKLISMPARHLFNFAGNTPAEIFETPIYAMLASFFWQALTGNTPAEKDHFDVNDTRLV